MAKRQSYLLLILLISMLVSGCAQKTLLLQQPITLQAKNYSKKTLESNVIYLPCYKEASISCQPLLLTDIRLLPGETILSLNAGDTARWLFQVMVSNTDADPLTHVLVKPKESHLKTNLIIATNRRTYHINLVSNEEAKGSSIVAFSDGKKTFCNEEEHTRVDSHYEVKIPHFQKIPSWAPYCVYNDGVSVYIHMRHLQQNAAPNFYVLNDQQHPLVVNYVTTSYGYRIDELFAKGLLRVGTEDKAQKVFINYIGKSQS